MIKSSNNFCLAAMISKRKKLLLTITCDSFKFIKFLCQLMIERATVRSTIPGYSNDTLEFEIHIIQIAVFKRWPE